MKLAAVIRTLQALQSALGDDALVEIEASYESGDDDGPSYASGPVSMISVNTQETVVISN